MTDYYVRLGNQEATYGTLRLAKAKPTSVVDLYAIGALQ